MWLKSARRMFNGTNPECLLFCCMEFKYRRVQVWNGFLSFCPIYQLILWFRNWQEEILSNCRTSSGYRLLADSKCLLWGLANLISVFSWASVNTCSCLKIMRVKEVIIPLQQDFTLFPTFLTSLLFYLFTTKIHIFTLL